MDSMKSTLFPVLPNPFPSLSQNNGNNSKSALSKSKRRRKFTFQVVHNSGMGDCLFLTLAEFLKKSHPTLTKDTLREEIVNFVVSNNNVNKRTNSPCIWSKYRHGVKVALEKHVPFFETYPLENEDEELEVKAKEEYKSYMSQPHIYGTYVELCAAMEKYSFNTTLLEEASSFGASNLFNICHIDVESPRPIRRRAYIAFTGSLDSGHFEFLQPVKPKCPSIPKGQYQVQASTDHTNLFTLITAPMSGTCNQQTRPTCNLTKSSSSELLAINYRTANKRTKCPALKKKEDDWEKVEKKPRIKLEDKHEDPLHPALQSSLSSLGLELQDMNVKAYETMLFKDEVQTLTFSYLKKLSNLKENFEKNENNVSHMDWVGVRRSHILSFGPVQTVFIEFQPKAFTCLSPLANSPLHVNVYHGKVLSVDEHKAIGEHVCQNNQTPQFILEPEKLYTLENHSSDSILVRLLWKE